MKNYLIDGKSESERLNFQNKMDICNLDEELAHFNWSTNLHVLDAGCGNGNVIEKLLEKRISQITGIDFSEDRIADAKKRFSSQSNVSLYAAPLENTQLKAEQFDVIICRYIYEHVFRPELVLKEMYRLLKPGGMIYIINFDDTVLNFYTKNPELNKALKDLKTNIPTDIEVGRKLPQFLKQNGFQSIDWDAKTYFFQGERLEMEKINSRMRFEQGRDTLSKFFHSLEEYDQFVEMYAKELEDECNVLSSHKFLIQAKKAA